MISKKHCFWLLVLPFYFLSAQNDTIILLDSCVIITPTLDNKINTQTDLNSVYEFDKNELDNHNASQLSDVMVKIPSVTLKDYGGIGGLKTISVRSLGANHTKIILDGVPLINTETGQIDLGKIPIENISSFSLSNQQWNAPLQTAHAYSGGSVLSIISTANNALFKKKNRFSAGLQQGSFGFWKGSLDWKHQLDSTSFLNFYTHFRSAHGIYPFTFYNGKKQETLQRNNSDIFEKQGILSYGKQWKKTKLTTKVFYTDSERGLPSAVILYNPTVGDRLWDKQFFIQNKVEGNKKKIEWNWVSKYNYSWKKYISPNFQNINQQIEDIYTQQTIFNSLAFSYKLAKKWKLFYSSDYDFSWLKSNVAEHPTPFRNTFLNVIGSNYQFKKFKVNANLLYTAINEHTEISENSIQKGKLTPSISVGYKPFWERDFRFRFSYKQSYRYPTFNDLYYVRVGNIDLKPELATQWNTGINYLFKGKELFFIQRLNLKLDAFLYEIDDKIVAIPTQNLFVWSMQNFGRVQTKGFEAYLNIYFKQKKHFLVDLSTGYSFQQALDKTNSNSSTYNQQIPYIPFETSNSHININYKKWILSWNYTYAGHRFFLPENTYENTLHAWQLHDIGLEYKNKKQKYTWRIKSSINNVFNSDYQVIINYPMPKINYRLSLFIEF